MTNKQLSIIIKPTHDCNLRCSYCYVDDNAESGRMDSKLLEKSIKKVSDYSDYSSWIWHGGEPLLMGIDFYKKVKEIQDFYKRKGKKFSNSIQTNGTLISNELISFVEKSRDFDIGSSIDGPEFLNNMTRKFSDGKGAYKKIMNGFELMQNRGIGVGAICVINSNNINNTKELYDFFKTKRIDVKFNPLIKAGGAIKNSNNLSITPEEYSKFLSEMFDMYNNDSISLGHPPIQMDPFIEAIGNLAVNRPLGCNYSVSCRESFISIGPQGDIYPCGRFDGDKYFWMGNVKKNTIEEALGSKINKKLKKRNLENTAEECGSCGFGEVCNSGCMHNAYLDGNVFGKDPYCSAYKVLYSKASSLLERENIRVKNGKE